MSVARGCSLCQSLGIIDPQNYCSIIVPPDLKVDSRLSPFVRSWLNGAIQTERVLYSSSAPLFLVFRTGYSSTLSMSRSLFLGLRSMTSWRIVFSRLLSPAVTCCRGHGRKCGSICRCESAYGRSSVKVKTELVRIVEKFFSESDLCRQHTCP